MAGLVKTRSKEIAGIIRGADKLHSLNQLGAAAGRTPRTLRRWLPKLDRGDPATFVRAEAAINRAIAKSPPTTRVDTFRRDAKGEPIETNGYREMFDSLTPPGNADDYRIFGVDENGKKVWSTQFYTDYDRALKAAAKYANQYRTRRVEVELRFRTKRPAELPLKEPRKPKPPRKARSGKGSHKARGRVAPKVRKAGSTLAHKKHGKGGKTAAKKAAQQLARARWAKQAARAAKVAAAKAARSAAARKGWATRRAAAAHAKRSAAAHKGWATRRAK